MTESSETGGGGDDAGGGASTGADTGIGAGASVGMSAGAGAGMHAGAGTDVGAAVGRPSHRRKSHVGLVGIIAVVTVISVLLGFGIYAVAVSGSGCVGGRIMLQVAVAPEIQPALADAAARFNERQAASAAGPCTTAVVQAADPASVATLLGQGAAVGAAQQPDVWIPDSSMWTALVPAPMTNQGSIAQSPLVAGLPQALADTLRQEGLSAGQLSWADLLDAAGAVTGGAGSGASPVLQQNLVWLRVPNPTLSATGLGLLAIADALQPQGADRRLVLTSIGEALRDHTVSDVASEFSSLRPDPQGRYPVVVASEQAVYAHNQSSTGDLVLAAYPRGGTLSLDYPYTVLTSDAQRIKAAEQFEATVREAATQQRLRALGFRTAAAPAASATASPSSAQQFAVPAPETVRQVVQAWYKLSLGIRDLSVIDVSGSMDQSAGPDLTRLQVAVQATQTMLGILPDDTQLSVVQTDGGSVPSTHTGAQDSTPSGQLGDKIGQSTLRGQLLAGLNGVRSDPHGALYDSVLSAFRLMNHTYQPTRVNSVLVFTAGNPDGSTITLEALLASLRQEYDPAHPVQIVVVEIGQATGQSALGQIAAVTHGAAYLMTDPQQIQQIVLSALSRRVCAPAC